MGQILSAVSGNDSFSREKERREKERLSRLSSRLSTLSNSQYSQYSHYNVNRTKSTENSRETPQLKNESTIPTSSSRQAAAQRSYIMNKFLEDPEWVEKFYQTQREKKLPAIPGKPISEVKSPYKIVTISEKKETSGVKDNATNISYSIGLKKMSSGVKENTISLSHRPSVEKKPTIGVKRNPTSLPSLSSNISSIPGESTTSLDTEDIKRITEIVRNILSRNHNYVVYGNWSCPHWPRLCDNEYEWQSKFTRESLQRYLTLNSESKQDFFMKPCEECNKKSLISSFFLYKHQPNHSNKKPTVEIICHLEWNNHYRVFAQWKCLRPQSQKHEWGSSYTYISLRNFIEETPANDLNKRSFYMQKCHDCKDQCKKCKHKPKERKGCKECDHDSIILSYNQLIQSGGGKPHKRWLCAKCKEGTTCTRTDKNYRAPRVRNINLF